MQNCSYIVLKPGSNVVMGDFNLLYINWDPLYCPDEHIRKIIFDFVISPKFSQFSTCELNTLDLVFIVDDCLITDVKSCPPLGCHHHHHHYHHQLTFLEWPK